MASLRLVHLYPDLMSVYGDRGNVLTLVRRAEWRGISIDVRELSIGDVLIETNLDGQPRTLVGFENHSGRTYLSGGVKPLGRPVVGAGNNGEDGTEGAVYLNAIGCYLHGSLLPKNPWLADWLLAAALRHRTQEP